MYIRRNDEPILEKFQFGTNKVERYSIGGKKIPTWVIVLVVLLFLILMVILLKEVFSKSPQVKQQFGYRFY